MCRPWENLSVSALIAHCYPRWSKILYLIKHCNLKALQPQPEWCMIVTVSQGQKQNWYRRNFGGEKLKTILAYYKICFLQWGWHLQKYLRAKIFSLQVVPISQLNSSQMNNCLWPFLVLPLKSIFLNRTNFGSIHKCKTLQN